MRGTETERESEKDRQTDTERESEGEITLSPFDHITLSSATSFHLVRYLTYSFSQVADMYENPGPLQFQGPSDLVDGVTATLTLETYTYLQDIKKLQCALASIQEACR